MSHALKTLSAFLNGCNHDMNVHIWNYEMYCSELIYNFMGLRVPTFERDIAFNESTAADGRVMQTELFILCLTLQIHTKISPQRKWKKWCKKTKKISCTFSKMCHTIDKRHPLCAQGGV